MRNAKNLHLCDNFPLYDTNQTQEPVVLENMEKVTSFEEKKSSPSVAYLEGSNIATKRQQKD